MNVTNFGKLSSGELIQKVSLYTGKGIQVEVITYGAIITNLWVDDANDQTIDVVLGFNNLDQYVEDAAYIGAVVGRYCNRIAGKFELDGKEYRLSVNDGSNCLHGGFSGFHKKVWKLEKVQNDSVTMSCLSSDGEDGFPGNMFVSVTYRLVNANTLRVEYSAKTDAPTHINFTQHTYFNLSGNSEETILGHEIRVNSQHFLPQNEFSVPTGIIDKVANSPFDLQEKTSLRQPLSSQDPQMQIDMGLNHTFVLPANHPKHIKVAELYCSKSGIQLNVTTSEPGIHLYCANHFDGKSTDKFANKLLKYSGICLETQHFPDSPNQPHFPSTRLDPGQQFKSFTEFQFISEYHKNSTKID